MKYAAVLFAVTVVAASPVFAQKEPPKAPDATQPAEPPKSEEKLVFVKMTTSKGDIYLELDEAKAPVSVKNFVAYTEKGHYDGTIFHRVIDNFMIQGGGFTADMKQKPTDAPIKNEWQNGLKNKRGTIAMARLGGGPNSADSATCQFFINVKDNDFLDQKQRDGAAYAVFGKVIGGMDVVDAIKGVRTGQKGGMGDVPVEAVTITKVAKISAEDAKAATKK